RAEEQRGRVHRAAGDDNARGRDADGTALARNFDGLDAAARGISEQAFGTRVRPQLDVVVPEGRQDAADFGVGLGFDAAWEGVAGVAEAAAIRLARPDQTER